MIFRALLALFLVGAAVPAAAQVVTTVAGTEWLFPHEPRPAVDAPVGGTLTMAVATDPSGNFYIADPDNHIVMRVRPDGVLEPFAGNGLEFFSGEGERAADAGLLLPLSVVADARGNVYIGEFSGRIRRVGPDGLIYTVAGDGTQGYSGDGGLAKQARIGTPRGLAVDLAGNLYLADSYAHVVRKISPDGIITTVAGNGSPGWSGDGGPATQAQLKEPGGITVDGYGNLYIADTQNAVVRAVTTAGIILTVAGGYGYDTSDGANSLSSLIFPTAVAIDKDGFLFVADTLSDRVFRFGADLIVHNVAGGNERGFSGDGGPAVKAQLDFPTGIALDVNGNLLIGERGNSRVRRVTSDGIIRTAAGNGQFRTGGDGGPATTAALYLPSAVATGPNGNLYIAEQLRNRVRRVTPQGRIDSLVGPEHGVHGPYGVATDSLGNVFITENFSNLIRKVTPDGSVSVIAGGGFGDAGEGVEASKALVRDPRHIAVDAQRNIYYAEGFGNRVRRISAAGIVTTIAGTGEAGFSGDGGPALQARLNQPVGVAVDRDGNVYIGDYKNHRVRKVTPSGVISTLAGTGRAEYSGDGGPASQASLNLPTGLEVDAAGNLYIADEFNHRIRKVSSAGIITTAAGSAIPGFRGDGGLAIDASFAAPTDVALDAAGTLYIADWSNHRIRAVLTQRPTYTADPASLEFRAKSGGLPSAEQTVQVAGSIPGVLFTVSTAGASWLKVSTQSGATPGAVRVSADPEALPPGEYTETLTFTAPNALVPVQRMPVHFTVEPADPPRLVARSESLTFLSQQRGVAVTQTLLVANEGGGSVAVQASATVPWLQVSPPDAAVTARAGAALEVTANPAGLPAGTYTGAVSLTDGSGAVSVPVTLLVRSIPQTIALAEVGLTFTAVAGGGVTPPRTVGIGNAGEGVMPWRARPVTLTGGQWLHASPAEGASTAGGELAEVEVSVDPSALQPGQYHGRVEILADGADNSPQAVAVILNVLPAGSDPGPIVQPSALIFRGVQGSVSPAAQYVFVSNLATSGASFRSGRLSEDGTPWFQHGPVNATVSPGRATRIVVQPDLSGLPAGVHHATLTLLFDSGVRRTVQLVFVVLPRVGGGRSLRRALEDCHATRLIPVFTALPESFQAPAGWPQELEVRVVDDCAAPMTTGSTVASFSNGDVPLMLQPLRDGRWTGTWQSRRASSAPVTVTVRAEMPDRSLRGAASVTGGLQGTQTGPVLRASPAVNAASLRPELPLAPGMLVSIFGSNLGEASSAQDYPWPTELGGTSVFLAGIELPLLQVAPDRIEAIVPFDVPVNARQQLIVQRRAATAVPEAVTVSAAQPAIYTKDKSGSGQGMIHVVAEDGSRKLAEPGSPAGAGDTVAMTCTGLGAVDPATPAGSPAPDEGPRVTAPVSVTIGGVDAPVVRAFLMPGATGLYEVHARVPQGVSGEAAPVVVTVGTESSPPVTMAVE